MSVKILRREGQKHCEVQIWVERPPRKGDGQVHVFLVDYRLNDTMDPVTVTVMWFRRDGDGVSRPFGSRAIEVDPAVDDPACLGLQLVDLLGSDHAASVEAHLRQDLWPF